MINPNTLTLRAEGQTRLFYRHPTAKTQVIVLSRDVLPALPGSLPRNARGKGLLANLTAVAVFKLLKEHGVPLAFRSANSPNSFIAEWCEMIPVRVKVSGVAIDSFVKRHPIYGEGEILDRPVVEFFLKTKDRTYLGHPLPCDDPAMTFLKNGNGVDLHLPVLPLSSAGFLVLTSAEVEKIMEHRAAMEKIAADAFAILAGRWSACNGDLVDADIEFGILPNGTLVIAGIIDCDSWHVIWKGVSLSNRSYHIDDDPTKIHKKYQIAADICAGWIESKHTP